MPPMRIRQRAFALVAILSIAWGSLWPLVSAAGPKSATIPNLICTQAGFQPHDAALPQLPDDHDKFHCPLCVMCADATLPAIAPSPTWVLAVDRRLLAVAPPAPHPYHHPPPPPRPAPPPPPP